MLGNTSHFPQMDKLTSWIIPWKVYTIAAYSNVGKSRFSYGYVNHFLKQGKKVVFLSLEVDKWLLLQHLMCNKYNVYQQDLTKEMMNIEDYKNLYIFDDLYKLDWIEEIINDFRPDYVFIDFVQNVQVWWQSGYDAMAMVARKIQQLSITTNATIFALSQLSNSVAKDISKWQMDFIALKWAWEFVASSDVIFLLRMVDWQIGLTIAKNKFWKKPDWEIFFDVNFWKSRFTLVQDPFNNKEVF
jgi:KaiC/GvpD/RAD55 family RecA-like ATPase